MQYIVFINDGGPSGYSCLFQIEAKSDRSALMRACDIARRFAPVKVLAIPRSRLDEAFVRGSEASPTGLTGLRPRRGVFTTWGARIL